MVPKSQIATGAQTVPNFLIVRTKWLSTGHWLLVDVRTEVMHCYISENQMIFYTCVDYKYYYEVKMNWTQVWTSSVVNFQRFLQLSYKNILICKSYSAEFHLPLMAVMLDAITNKLQ